MERKQRHLDGETGKKSQEEPLLHFQGKRQLAQLRQAQVGGADKSAPVLGQIDHGHQQQQAAGQGIEQELHRRVHAPPVPPHADQQEYRQQGRLAEHVEQEEVQRGERADHHRGQRQHGHGEFLRPQRHRNPGREKDQGRQQGGQEDQEQTETVDPQVEVDAEGRYPGVALDELHARGRAVEPEIKLQGEQEFNRAQGHGPPLDEPFPAARQHRQNQGPDQG